MPFLNDRRYIVPSGHLAYSLNWDDCLRMLDFKAFDKQTTIHISNMT